jgi:hypothetical protein
MTKNLSSGMGNLFLSASTLKIYTDFAIPLLSRNKTHLPCKQHRPDSGLPAVTKGTRGFTVSQQTKRFEISFRKE